MEFGRLRALNPAVVKRHNAAAFLAAMLLGKKPEINHFRGVRVTKNTNNTALFFQ